MMQCLVGPYSTERVIHSSHMDEVNIGVPVVGGPRLIRWMQCSLDFCANLEKCPVTT